MSKKNETGRKATTAVRKCGILKDTTLADFGKHAPNKCVGRILEREAKRHEVGKFAGVSVAVVMPDGTKTSAALSDYGYAQLFIGGNGDTPADHVRDMIEGFEDAPIDGKARKRASAYFRKHTAGMRYADYSAETRAMIDELADKRGLTRDEVVARFEELFAGRGPGNGAKVFTAEKTEPVTFTDDGNAVTIRVTGKAYANLAKIADALNGVSWADRDNSPVSVLEYWVGSLIRRTADTPADCDWQNVAEICADMKTDLDTGAEEGSKTDKRRREELKAALDAIKF